MGYLLNGLIKYLYKGTTNDVSIDSNEDIVANQIIAKANYKKPLKVNNNITLDTYADEVISVDTTAGDITITLPLASSIPNDGYIRKFTITKISDDSNVVYINTTAPDTFPLGYSSLTIGYKEEVVSIGGSFGGWGKTSSIKVATLAHRTSTWAAGNFTSWTAIPFEHTDVQDNTEIFEWDIANPTRLTCKVNTRVNTSYAFNIDSTGGSTWNVDAKMVINGVTDIEYSKIKTGNYGGEDSTLALPHVPVELSAGDYIELQLLNSNLTGNVFNAIIQIDSLL